MFFRSWWSTETKTPRIHILLDIDETLATAYDKHRNIDHLLLDNHSLQAFDDNQFIQAIFPHLLHPGVLEFIQWIMKNPDIKLSFFSSGHHMRNEEFVDELLKRALGKDFNLDVVEVYSRHHLFANLKNLEQLSGINNLDNVILVDDNPGYIAPGQERNVLLIPAAYNIHFEQYYTYPDEVPDFNILGTTLQAMNHIFYVTGILRDLVSLKNKCLADNLYDLQYKQQEDSSSNSHESNSNEYSRENNIRERNTSLHNDPQYYLNGLAELRKINPALDFHGGDFAIEYFNRNTAKSGNSEESEDYDGLTEPVCSLKMGNCQLF